MINEESTWGHRMPFQEVPSGCMTEESPLKFWESYPGWIWEKKIWNYNSQRPTVTHNNKRERGSSWERRQTDRLRKENQRDRNWHSFSSIDGVSHGSSRGGELTKRNPLKMAKTQEVEHIAKKLDKMVHKKNTVSAKQLLHQHKTRDQVVSPTTAERDNSGNTLLNSAHWPVEDLNVCR